MTDSSALWNGVAQGAVSATTTFATSVANNYVSAINIMNIGTSDWYNKEQADSFWDADGGWKNTI